MIKEQIRQNLIKTIACAIYHEFRQEYTETVLPRLISFEHPVNMPDWFVPETYYYMRIRK